MLTATPAPSGAVEIIAHRGASHDAPENTLAAFRLAWEQNADAIELDIWMSKDGGAIVIHNPGTRRTAQLDKRVAEQTVAELQALEAGTWKGERWAREPIPTLSQALDVVPEGKRVFVEIKCGSEVLGELNRVVESSGKAAQVVLMGFDIETMRAAKALMPDAPALWLSARALGPPPKIESLIERAREAGLDGLDGLNLDFRIPIDAHAMAKVQAAGMQLGVWTVDDPAVARRLAQAGVDAITTNRPAWLREQMDRLDG